MKTKVQKQEELKQAEQLLAGSKFLAFAEFSGISAEDTRKLRRSAKQEGADVLMIKKRLLAIALKNKGVDFDTKQFKSSIGTVFAPDMEKASSAVYKFFSSIGETKEDKAANVKKILGGYDLNKMSALDAGKVIAIGQLPPRDVILAQFMGMLVAPLRMFMYILEEKAKQMAQPSQNATADESVAAKEEPKSEIPAEEAKTEEISTSTETPAEEPQADLAAEASTKEAEANPNPETPAESKPEEASQ